MKTYAISPIDGVSPISRWTIAVELNGRSKPTFQSFRSESEALLMVERLKLMDLNARLQALSVSLNKITPVEDPYVPAGKTVIKFSGAAECAASKHPLVDSD